MKAGIITFHFANNFGAALQAYALLETIKKIPDVNAEIIDYQYWFIKFTDTMRLLPIDRNPRAVLSGLCTFSQRIRRKKKFEEFYKKNYCLSEKCLCYRELKKLDGYDAYVCGSDQIWNPKVTLGITPAYFLKFVPKGKIRISYAASFGVDIIDNKVLSHISEMLSGFKAISVREKSSAPLLEKKMGQKVESLIDPVFLLHREQWDLLAGPVIMNRPYILIYVMQNNEEVYRYAKKAKELLNIPVVAISRYGYKANKVVDYAFIDVGPVEFINFIKNAEYVCTNSFHGLAFSVIFEKKFFVLSSNRFNSRINDLLALLKLVPPREISKEVVQQKFYDCNVTQKIIEKEREKAMAYLRGNLIYD